MRPTTVCPRGFRSRSPRDQPHRRTGQGGGDPWPETATIFHRRCGAVGEARQVRRPGDTHRIDAFSRQFRIPDDGVRDIGRLFDQARENPRTTGLCHSAWRRFCRQSRHAGTRARLFVRDRPRRWRGQREGANVPAWRASRVPARPVGWDRASGAAPARPSVRRTRPLRGLGVARSANPEELHAAWRKLMRENHPGRVGVRGVPKDFIDKAASPSRDQRGVGPHQAGARNVTATIDAASDHPWAPRARRGASA